MDTSSIAVQLNHISHRFRDKLVLSDVSVSFKKNEKKAILGRSGSGKSTLLQIINGMIRPAQGEIILLGKLLDYKNIIKARLQMGYVVQEVGLFPHLTIRENINLLGSVTHQPKEQ